ncbi:response regulator transcription factor [Anaerosporobacter faecicola]|uniref:response regulator transcription factor n=1 Tax=Anaerosporobacter faecicola TaxID=2718714 RepID=UPI00143C2E11|nr:response regulator transcription factor [Anaerosporobacter faecicola]
MQHILIIEDDEDIAEIEQDYLEINQYQTTIASDGLTGRKLLNEQSFDLVILDIMLPGINGFQLLKEIRDRISIPILMVTAKNETVDKIRGLGFGADDYLTKPFDPAELVARVKSHLSRYDRLTNQTVQPSNQDVLNINELSIHKKAWKVYLNEKEIKMANREFELLVFLAENPNIVFSKEQLFEQIWGFDYCGDSATVAVHINRIREKIEKNPSKPAYIETIWGAGYRFNI